MIEVKNVFKSYKIKRRNPVAALKDITCTFPDKGMFFVIGRSGSGKSTLFNIIGGLDKADSGEVIVDGKNTADFTKEDFDNYRNQHIGFIFQEYNLLNRFNVKDNIAVALDLQGGYDKELIENSLKAVGLEGYADRRIKELSGGEKQRVAIARAVIKNPEIILADEPTGALDEDTGRQILDILKELSKEKLVVIISHDTDFAKEYGDGILELSKGTIKSNTIFGDIDSNREAKEPKKEKHLSFKKTLRLGFNWLTVKPVRLIASMLLSIVTLTLFGLADTVSAYNEINAVTSTIVENDIGLATFQKFYNYEEEGDYSYSEQLAMGDADLTTLKNETGLDFTPVYLPDIVEFSDSFAENYLNASHVSKIYGIIETDANKLSSLGFSYVGKLPSGKNEIAITNYTYSVYAGTSFTNVDGDEYTAQHFNSIEEFLALEPTLAVYNDTEEASDDYATITAVIDTQFEIGQYTELEGAILSEDDVGLFLLRGSFETYLESSYHAMAFVGDGFISKSEAPSIIESRKAGTLSLGLKEYGGFGGYYIDYVSSVGSVGEGKYYFFDPNKTSLSDGEVLIDINYTYLLPKALQVDDFEALKKYAKQNIETAILNGFDVEHWANEYDYIYYPSDIEELAFLKPAVGLLPIGKLKPALKAPQSLQLELTPEQEQERKIEIFAYYLFNDGYLENTYSDKAGFDVIKQEYINLFNAGHTLINAALEDYCITITTKDGAYNSIASDINVVGITFMEQDILTVSDSIFNAFKNAYNARYSYAIAQMPADRKAVKSLVEYSFNQKDDVTGYSLTNTATAIVEQLGDYIRNIAEWFIYIGIGFAALAIGMFLNFLLSAIKDSVSEIGILRALGARNKDIMSIFIIQSGVIALVNFIFAVILTAVLAIVADNLLQETFTIFIKALEFGIRQVGVLLGVSLGVSLIGAVLPVAKVLRQEPVDVIRT
ncbi:MAG: ATP-binding cassette domain-containing protein [Clostridia bacterium]|nr:ATP-binding cassette domain-containing protein [Clostridia bacterium]